MELNKLSASELLEGLSKKDFSPKEVLDDCVKRIEKIDPAMNAFPAPFKTIPLTFSSLLALSN